MARDYISDYQKNTKQGDQKFPQLNGVLQLLGGFGGAVGGGIAGAGAGALVPGADLTGVPEVAGGYVGGVAGAGIGSGAGNAGADWIRANILGDKTVNPSQTLPNSVDAAKAGAIGQAIGGPLAKTLGFAAHPIQPFIERVNSILDKSDKTINIGDVNGLLQDFKSNELPKLYEQGHGEAALKAYNDLADRVSGMVSAMKSHIPAEAGATGDVASMTVPISQANTIKRNLYQLIGDNYGEIAKPNIEAMKGFANLTKEAVAQAEPGVRLPNAIASALYKVPDTASALTSILGLGQPNAARAIKTIGDLPFNVIQKLIPSGGGYLNQVLPRGLQSLIGAGQNH